ncbi:hypothetical protein N7452_003786 [Penicillium brevicompactum]|uniref:Uncharacterized protein n=1 Tax=Penicillium brevicompactum TaxID=5074 RepID=A0A9W9QUC7_PENBR|nr:hypothetical protein N7452_003786 [Penicillium brevicompactum]
MLLAAPLVTIIGYFDHDPKSPISNQSPLAAACVIASNDQIFDDLDSTDDPDSPEGNWYEYPETFRAIYCVTIFSAHSLLVIVVASQGTFNKLDRSTVIAEFQFIWMYLILAFTGTYGVILFSLMIGSLGSKGFRIGRVVLQSINWAMFFLTSFSISVDPEFPFMNVWRLCAQPLAYAFYVVCAIS